MVKLDEEVGSNPHCQGGEWSRVDVEIPSALGLDIPGSSCLALV